MRKKRGDATHDCGSGAPTAQSLLGRTACSHQQSNFEKGVQREENSTDALLRKGDKWKRRDTRRWGSNHMPSIISHINKSVIVKLLTSTSSVLCIRFGKMAWFWIVYVGMGMVAKNLCLEMLYSACLKKKKQKSLIIFPLLSITMCNNRTCEK